MQSAGSGWGNGLLGVIIFSGSLPATRVAVGGFSALFLTSARAIIAALIGAAVLVLLRQTLPQRRDIASLTIVSIGVVVGFPLLTALALQHITSAHSIVFIGLLPLSTAIFAVLRGGERPQPLFWLFAVLGSATVAGFALSNDGSASLAGDLLMIAAIVLCGLGYAEGAALSRRIGGWQVISWALLLALPLMLPVVILTWPSTWSGVSAPAWIGLAYVSIFSMFVGFIFWYRGLAIGGIARVGQLQQLQPFFGLALAGFLLHEPVAWSMIAATALVVVCVFFARRYA
ncbi:DMT family transporter [Bradyrhizobium manausense]|uniref:DMT family transporter n=1 Tax=Bradyrhizobium manausense TaxID=989370 RepID=UPI001BA859C0|nr:DMT family transporter [Bradyrhizobium manausense]MBR0690699.1 DMT family transporter [Bradyrhizobium manausense]MBR0719921.1 DMT family transporter [Bradyrhizobium manausense]MBR0833191.1 DMT family transporter [Bradyrhizobium manausense]